MAHRAGYFALTNGEAPQLLIGVILAVIGTVLPISPRWPSGKAFPGRYV